jgi:hypothetical protein
MNPAGRCWSRARGRGLNTEPYQRSVLGLKLWAASNVWRDEFGHAEHHEANAHHYGGY